MMQARATDVLRRASAPAGGDPAPRPTPRRGMALTATGLGAAIAAALGLALVIDRGGAPASNPGPALRERNTVAEAPSELMLTYAPGQTSGWHVHPGVHEVTVLSGFLTIYREDCQRRTYGPGDRYVGGPDRHMALNESAERLEMAVRWIFATEALPEAVTIPSTAPLGCDDDVRSGRSPRLDGLESFPPGSPASPWAWPATRASECSIDAEPSCRARHDGRWPS